MRVLLKPFVFHRTICIIWVLFYESTSTVLLLVRSYLNQNCASLSGRPTWKPTFLFPTIIHIYSVLFKPCIQRWWPRKRRKALYVSIELFFELTNNWAFHGTGDDMAARTIWNDALNFNDNMKPSELLARKAVMSRFNGTVQVHLLAPGIEVMVLTLRRRNLGSSWMIMHPRHIHLRPF